jgi:hypothetical protein
MSSYMQERKAKLARMYAMPGRRKARISLAGAKILRMLGPYPWEPGRDDFTMNGQNISWSRAYDERILGQSSAPGFPAKDRQRIEAAYDRAGQARTRRLLGRTASTAARRRGAR